MSDQKCREAWENYESIKEIISYCPENGKLTRISNGKPADYIGGRPGYFSVSIKGKRFQSHRICWLLHNKEWPSNIIDHINGNGFDNRIANLRDVTHKDNMNNTYKHRNGKRTGISIDPKYNTWRVRIKIDGKLFSIGSYKSEEEAILAYQKASNNPSSVENGSFSKKWESGIPPGISFSNRENKWMVRTKINGKSKSHGYYITLKEAKTALEAIHRLLVGEE